MIKIFYNSFSKSFFLNNLALTIFKPSIFFFERFRVCSAYVVELWELFEGFKLALSHGFSRVELHADSQVVVNTITFVRGGSSIRWTLHQNIRRLLKLN